MLKKLTFRQQWWVMAGIVFCGFLMSVIFKRGIISNAAWILAGLLFVIHPVCPETWKWRYGDDNKKMRRDCRIAGVVIIVLGLLIKFGV